MHEEKPSFNEWYEDVISAKDDYYVYVLRGEGAALYVGSTRVDQLRARMASHYNDKDWVRGMVTRCDLARIAGRISALELEKQVIGALNPPHNKVKPSPSLSVEFWTEDMRASRESLTKGVAYDFFERSQRPDTRGWVTTKEWAERRCVNPSYARKLVRLGKLPHKTVPGPGAGGIRHLVPADAEPKSRSPIHDEEIRAKWREAQSRRREKLSDKSS